MTKRAPWRYAVVSGPAASGKTTLGLQLGDALALPVLDKDDLLEALFDQHEEVDSARRDHLSRLADEQFIHQARTLDRAVLVSWWRHPGQTQRSGTPTEWLGGLGRIVEVRCVCDPLLLAERFVSRHRHHAHGDVRSLTPDVVANFERTSAFGPLRIGDVICVDTGCGVDTAALAARLTAA